MKMPIAWHFPRPLLASTLLATLHTGLAQAVTVMAAPGMGKSEFLQADLLPQAERDGWRVRHFACASVSQRVLMPRLEDVLSDFAAGERWLAQQLARLSGTAAKSREPLPQRLAHELAQLRDEKKPSLLLLDDVDLVLRQPEGESVLRDVLRAFAGTGGQARLVASLTPSGDARAVPPLLLQQSSVFTLPDIGDGFVHHLVGQYQQLTGSKRQEDDVFGKLSSPYQGITWGQVDERVLLEAFDRLQRVPRFFRAMVEDLVLNPERSPAEALQLQLANLQRLRLSALSWEDMSRLDRLLLLEVARGTTRFYAAELREHLARLTGVAQIPPSQIQNSLKKLLRNRILGKDGNGRHVVIDPTLAATLAAEQRQRR
jgi:hypothetical protein